MKLKEFNPENCVSGRHSSSVACIGISLKGGLFRINKGACELIGIKPGDCLKFHQDEEDGENWYVEKVKGGGFETRAKHTIVGGGVIFNNTRLAKEIFSSVSYDGGTGKVLIAGQPTLFDKRKLFGVITSTLRN